MARILYSWELGGGLGHLSVIHPVIKALRNEGYQIGGIVCDATHADQFLGSLDIRYARIKPSRAPREKLIEPLCTFAHVLHNSLLANQEACYKNCQTIQKLIGDFRPDLIICDHAPATLIATRGSQIPTVVWGTGFTCPPPGTPLPDWRPSAANAPIQLANDEHRVLVLLNAMLRRLDLPECQTLTEIYAQASATLLTTFAELDHFPNRQSGQYVGTWNTIADKPPHWPKVAGPKVFAYLKPTDKLPLAIAALAKLNVSAVIFSPGHHSHTQHLAVPKNVHLSEQPIDMQRAADECDAALLNGTHTSVMQMLRAGKPIVSLPLLLEQQLTATTVARLHAGECLLKPTSEQLAEALQRATEPDVFPGARYFSHKYGGVTSEAALTNVVAQIEKVLSESDS